MSFFHLFVRYLDATRPGWRKTHVCLCYPGYAGVACEKLNSDAGKARRNMAATAKARGRQAHAAGGGVKMMWVRGQRWR